jgi:hypothetical protein
VITVEIAGSGLRMNVLPRTGASRARTDSRRCARSCARKLLDTEESYLDAVARDLLKAVRTPAITVPLAAGMDAFALRCGATVARSHPMSVVQVAESRLGSRAFAFAAPVLLQPQPRASSTPANCSRTNSPSSARPSAP